MQVGKEPSRIMGRIFPRRFSPGNFSPSLLHFLRELSAVQKFPHGLIDRGRSGPHDVQAKTIHRGSEHMQRGFLTHRIAKASSLKPKSSARTPLVQQSSRIWHNK
jgi:hypothetical protein